MESKGREEKKSQVALREEEILAFWEDNRIFEESLKKNEGKKEFIFYDGPPFATGLPHYGHILPGTIKDVIPRFKTMQGFHVRRTWGWDCHGLPIENIVEKELGLKSKKDILEMGINTFNKAARSRIMRYADDWKRIIPRTGRWVDMEHDYKTMDPSYTESVWWAFKKLYDKGLVYEGFKSMHICPRCETTLSNFEVNQGYKDITDISVYVKFEILNSKFGKSKENLENQKTYFLAWTTTPWTLPGNVALAVDPKKAYCLVGGLKSQVASGEKITGTYILAKNRLVSVLKDYEYEIIEELEGKRLIGLSYIPIFDYYVNSKLENKDRAWKVYGADFVTTEEGTGVVHIAPAFGSDDYELSQKEKLPFIQHVSFNGKFKDEVEDFKGQAVKPKDDPLNPSGQAHQKADIEIIKNLARRSLLFAKEKITHAYPYCWRCETPLLNYATSSWFLKVIAIKDKLIAENRKVLWIPEHVKEGRFGKWLESAKDWAISRSRFWGAPLPVWVCDICKKSEVIGSIKEMSLKNKARNTYYVMRHGEAESNVLGIVSSDPNLYGLTEKGKDQVLKNLQKLKNLGIDLIVTSSFRRTKETARMVKEALGLPDSAFIVESLIHEINMGVFNGKSIQEYREYATHHHRFTKAPPDGESQLDVKKRVGDCMVGLEKRYQEKTILIITHDTPAWLLFAAAEGRGERKTYELHGNKDFFLKNAEIRRLPFSPIPRNEKYEIDLHRPYIDAITFTCVCGGKMKRVPEIFDTWLDSGSMPFAQFHYPFENRNAFNPKKGLFKKAIGFPADFIAEGLDQTRGWFYTLLVLSVALFGKAPFKTAVVNGLILAQDGRKMAKSLKNYPDPMDVVNAYGADALRLYLLKSPLVRAEEVNFSEKGVDEIYKKNILRLKNVVSFYELFSFSDTTHYTPHATHILDKWIIARMDELIQNVTASLLKYELDKAVEPIADFIDDLSVWYIRRSRDRFKSDDNKDKQNGLSTTRFVLVELSKVMAPFAPFIAEDVYQTVKSKKLKVKSEDQEEKEEFKKSVHLESWPLLNIKGQLLNIIQDMKEVRRIVSLGLEARAKANIKVRQPLQKLKVKSEKLKIMDEQLIALIKDEVNVKEVFFSNSIPNEVEFDTVITPQLKEEGDVREFVRAIQELRKKEMLTMNDRVILHIETNDLGRNLIEKNKEEIMKATSLKNIEFGNVSAEGLEIAGSAFKMRF